MSLERFCPWCGRRREEGEASCPDCGRAFREVEPPPAQGVLVSNVDQPRAAPVWRVTQSPWLIAALTFTTFNLYGIWWLGRTWAQFKRELDDPTKRPVWHALAMLVPIYGYTRFYVHMRTMARLAPASVGVQPGAMTLAWVLVNVVDYTSSRPEAPLWLLLVSAGLGAALFGWAQHVLNTTWRALPGGAVPGHAHPFHWVVMTSMSLLYVLTFIGTSLGQS